jgi:hypothetical protein
MHKINTKLSAGVCVSNGVARRLPLNQMSFQKNGKGRQEGGVTYCALLSIVWSALQNPA